MNWADFFVILIICIILGVIVFFEFFFKKKTKSGCRYCEKGVGKKGKRLIKDYKKKYQK